MAESPQAVKFGRIVDVLTRSGLVPPEKVKQALLELSKRPETAQEHPSQLTRLGSWLVCQGLLTCWQFHKLCDGKWRGFFLDDYKLLDHLDTDDAYSYYLAEHVATGGRAAIRVTPAAHAKDPGKIEYLIVYEYH